MSDTTHEHLVPPKAGLEDVVAGTSEICFIDGDKGRLIYRGYDIHELINASFEEVMYLLWYGALPTATQLTKLKEQLLNERKIPVQVRNMVMEIARGSHPMEVLRTAVSMTAAYDADRSDMSREANLRKAIRLTAQLPIIIATALAATNGKSAPTPSKTLGHAANFLFMIEGKEPDTRIEKMFDICLTLHADHEFNASTFTARVIAGTLSDMHSAITGAIGALKGPLHGGANEQVMKMLIDIGDPTNVANYIHEALASKKKIMGFGHRVYHTEDPRATHLRQFSKEMGERMNETKWYEMSIAVEEMIKAEKKLNPNVDFYSASTYYLMGIPINLFTPIFAASRVTGWAAHVLEQYSNNRLIRPMAEYTGKVDLKFVPIESRN